MATLYTPYATSPSTWASTSTATYPPTYPPTYRVRVPRQHPQYRRPLAQRPPRSGELSDTDEEEDDAVEDASFYRRASIDSQRSRTSMRSFTSAYPVFPVLPPNPWPQADPNALPSYSPPDPSSPFTSALYEEDDSLYAPKRRCSSPFGRKEPLELARIESSRQALLSSSPLDESTDEDSDV